MGHHRWGRGPRCMALVGFRWTRLLRGVPTVVWVVFWAPVPLCFLPLTARQASLGSYFLLSCCAPLAASLTHLAIIVSIFLCFFQRQVSVGCQLR